MRTTLKRGIGRGATLDGDGHAVLPPRALVPMTLYRQPKRGGAFRFIGKVLFTFAAAAAMVLAGIAGGYALYVDETVAGLRPSSPDVREAQRRLDEVPPPDRPAIALALGYDRRLEDIKLGDRGRSDSIMLLRADPQSDSVSMLSFPRDLRVEVHCPRRATFVDRINQAYNTCGAVGTLETVRQLTGVPINYLITVNFKGFTKMVASVGGVWMDVDRRYFNDNADGGERYAEIDLKPGYQKLRGVDALAFVRYRHTDTDVYRNARQQMFVRALKEQISHSFLPTSIRDILKAIRDNVEIARGGREVDWQTLYRYGVFGYQLPPGRFFQARIENLTDTVGTEGQIMLSAAPGDVDKAVQEFLAPDVEAAEKATAVALRRKYRPKTRGLSPRQVTLVALNGNGRTGSATNAGYLLGRRGYRVLVPNAPTGNAPGGFGYFRTKVYFQPSQPALRPVAQQLAYVIGSADVAPMPPPIVPVAGEAMLAVVVGDTFHGTLVPAPVDKTPKPQRPEVVRDPATSLPLLRQVRRQADFPLLLPAVIERNSRPDPAMPVRAYTVGGHKTIRLTYRLFRDGVYQYWGIQQTGWEDAPALNERSTTRYLGGRRYDLYYSGPKLHMVVLRQGGATYWVVNTLLDSLSNETMLAIARGLRQQR